MKKRVISLWEVMEPVLVFGGPYSNFQATQEMKHISQELGIPSERVFCAGDSVAYCGEPEATVQLLQDWWIHMIVGNTEVQLREKQDNCGCGFEKWATCDTLSNIWYNYAQKELSEASLSYFDTLPDHIEFSMWGKKITLVHGAYSNISKFIFPSTSPSEKELEFTQTKADIILATHSGIPFLEQLGEKTWVNVWVVWMPANDGTLRAWYYLITPQNDGRICIERKSFLYNAALTEEIMRMSQLSPEYSQVFHTGLWENCDILPEKETSEQWKPLIEEKHII